MAESENRRICCWVPELYQTEEIRLKNKSFRGWTVRIYRTAGGFDTEYLHHEQPVPLNEMTGEFTSALLQNDAWTREGLKT